MSTSTQAETALPAGLPRRTLMAAVASLAGLAAGPLRAQDHTPSPIPHRMLPEPDSGPRPRVAMLVYPRMILLDLVGPQTVLNIAGCDIDLVWKSRDAVSTDVGVPLIPTATFEDYDAQPDVLFVPGGLMGSLDCMGDPAVLAFLRAKAATATWVTSVCTGSLVLGAAGLLQGYRATSHWGVRDLLPMLGATLVTDRVVEDRNRITGGGATAGLDFGLVLAERLKDRATAERVQLILEYAPQPPFDLGTPELAGPERLNAARARRVGMDEEALKATQAAASRLRRPGQAED